MSKTKDKIIEALNIENAELKELQKRTNKACVSSLMCYLNLSENTNNVERSRLIASCLFPEENLIKNYNVPLSSIMRAEVERFNEALVLVNENNKTMPLRDIAAHILTLVEKETVQ